MDAALKNPSDKLSGPFGGCRMAMRVNANSMTCGRAVRPSLLGSRRRKVRSVDATLKAIPLTHLLSSLEGRSVASTIERPSQSRIAKHLRGRSPFI